MNEACFKLQIRQRESRQVRFCRPSLPSSRAQYSRPYVVAKTMSSHFKTVFNSAKFDRRITLSESASRTVASADGGSSVQVNQLRFTLRNLTVAMCVGSFVFLNPLACVCILPAVYYTFSRVRAVLYKTVDP